MNIKSFFRKNNYIYLYNLIKPYDKSVLSEPKDNSQFSSLDYIIDYLELKKYDSLTVVACGPSANQLKNNDNTLYLSTNRAIKLTNMYPFIYMVTDPFCLVDYIKNFKTVDNWKGTFFWYFTNEQKNRTTEIKMLKKYLKSNSREKREFLITNTNQQHELQSVHKEIINFCKQKMNIDYFGVNSGFQILVLGYLLAYKSNIPLKIYGLDLGEKEEAYFNRRVKLGKTIKSDFTKKKVSEFLDKIYDDRIIDVQNFSYFKSNLT